MGGILASFPENVVSFHLSPQHMDSTDVSLAPWFAPEDPPMEIHPNCPPSTQLPERPCLALDRVTFYAKTQGTADTECRFADFLQSPQWYSRIPSPPVFFFGPPAHQRFPFQDRSQFVPVTPERAHSVQSIPTGFFFRVCSSRQSAGIPLVLRPRYTTRKDPHFLTLCP